MRDDIGMPVCRDSSLPPRGVRGVAFWSSERWRREALAWIDAELARRGERRTGDVEQPSLRPWATVLRVPTSRGTVWLKAASEQTAAEVGLYSLLVSVVPRQVLHPIAADAARGWLLLPDGGTSIRDSLGRVDIVEVLERVLPEYGALQLELAPHLALMLHSGVDDMRPERMHSRFDQAAAAVQSHIGTEDQPSYERAVAYRPVYETWARELAESPVPHSIDHNDLHAANMLLPSADAGVSTRFYDWGDAVVAHPFASMLHGLGWVPPHLGVSQDDPQVQRLRDAYLGAFSAFGSHAELVRTLELACRVAKVARCLSWLRALEMGDEATGFERAPVELFTSILDPSYLTPV
jgi:hypothetical protein